jgi:phage terminase small subunit
MHRRAVRSEDPLEHLTVKERRFIEAYLGEAGGNGTQAAEIAGYGGSRHTLKCVAQEVLRRPEVRAAITSLMEHDPLVPSRIERLRFLGSVMRGEAFGERMNAEGDVVKVGPSIGDRQQACRQLGELAGDFRRAAKGDSDEDALPPGLSIDELFDLAGIPRPPSPPPHKPEVH